MVGERRILFVDSRPGWRAPRLSDRVFRRKREGSIVGWSLVRNCLVVVAGTDLPLEALEPTAQVIDELALRDHHFVQVLPELLQVRGLDLEAHETFFFGTVLHEG
jgi:hypothetical protein